MSSSWLGIMSIFFLVGLNGFFSCSEIAIIAVRRSRIKQLMEEGNQRAGLVNQLQEDPERFLATIQIGVTFVSSLAAALGGVLAVKNLNPLIQKIPNEFVRETGEVLAVGLVVVAISYLSLIVGELVPKSLALKYSEPIALRMAFPIIALSKLASGIIKILTFSSRLVLGLLRVGNPQDKASVSEEEIKILVREGREKGVFDQTEQDLIHSAFEFADISVKEVMVPSPQMYSLGVDTPEQEFLEYIASHKFSRYPIHKGDSNDIIGILYYKDFVSQLIKRKSFTLSELIRPVHFVPETTKISKLLKELQRRRMHMAIVVNEYGSVAGLVTMEDLLEEIVGEIQDETDQAERPVERLGDGSMVVDAGLTIRDLHDDYGLALPESPEYETLGGFFLSQLQQLPRGGENIRHGSHKFTIVDVEGHRIAKVKVEKLPVVSKNSS